MFLSFYVLDEFFRFSKKMGFWVFSVHPTVVSVLLSASVERCFVSRMRDFFLYPYKHPFVGLKYCSSAVLHYYCTDLLMNCCTVVRTVVLLY